MTRFSSKPLETRVSSVSKITRAGPIFSITWESRSISVCRSSAYPFCEVPGRCESGYFISPAVVEGLDPFCRTNQEEIFGPVVTLIPFKTEDQAVEWANCTPYGLAATIWTQDLSRAHRVADQVESGIIWINCWMVRDLRTPFGGMKQSGLGREGGWEALRFFTEPKNICLKI